MMRKILGGVGVVFVVLAVVLLVAWNTHTTVTVERTFRASGADVWRVWTESEAIQKWWGPKGYSGVVVRNEVRDGESFLWAMKSKGGRTVWNSGTYTEVVQGKRLVSSMAFSDESGKVIPGSRVPVPGRWPDAITVVVDFRESEGKTKVTVTEVGIPLIVYPLSKLGWSQQFEKVQALL